jgi:hypothetical protein
VRRAPGGRAGARPAPGLAEGLVIAALGGALGVLLALWSKDLLLLAAPDTLPRTENIAIDLSALGFAFLLSLVVGLGLSLLPALHVLRADPAAHLQGGGKGVAGARHRSLGLLVTSEVALAFLLLFGSGLLLRTFDRLLRVPLGFDPNRVLAASLVLPESRYAQRNPDRASPIVEAVRPSRSGDGATVIGSPPSRAAAGGTVAIEDGRPSPKAGGEEPGSGRSRATTPRPAPARC